ncbi:probable multidrug resistance-associated protein lethal(2)03659 isoform X2 [Zophobas morio]|uniref:probable multidrug resistance-associated protein lethal(2)03659 isoform X2 n=1 Tax=Zophobas morio TaxID=2755281 RepID=UPI003082E974
MLLVKNVNSEFHYQTKMATFFILPPLQTKTTKGRYFSMDSPRTKKIIINKTSKNGHPKEEANFLSHFLFCWQLKTVFKCWKNGVTDDNFTTPIRDHESQLVGDRLEALWNKENISRKKPSFTRALAQFLGIKYVLLGLLFSIVDTLSMFLQSLYLGKLLEYFSENKKLTAKEAYIYGLAVVLSILLRVISFQFHYLEIFSTGLKVRTSCCSLIYRKIITSKFATIQKNSLAHILNLFSTDLDKFETVFCYFHRMWSAILKIIVATLLFLSLSSYQGAVGVGIIVIFSLSQHFFFTRAAARREKVTKERDSRIHIMNDIIFRMREIKTYAWETPFAELINKIRRCEVTHMRKLNHIWNENNTIAAYIHKISIYVFIILLATTGTPLNPQLIFMSVNIYNLLKISVQHSIIAVNLMSDLKECITRIETFLLSDDESRVDTEKIEGIACCKIYAHNLTAKWNPSQNAAIKDINFILSGGQLVAVTGNTGIDGILSQDGLISYASQNPWIFSATIQENIIFNETFNQNKYLNVLKICALEYDISLFSHGDQTLVGERGAMLSGGQKARINLARAIYKDADIYLLDNPLAAMDVSVAQQIFTQCILQYLKTKSVLLITHNLKFLNYSDKVYVLEDGKIKFFGKYETLEETPNSIQEYNNKTVTKLSEKNYKAQIETKEHRGSHKVNTYTTYLFANKSKFFVYLQFFLFILTQVFINGSDAFLSFWINLRQNPTSFNTTLLQYFSEVKCLYIYSGFILIMVFLFHVGSLNFVECCNNCSVKLHDTLFNKILYGTMNFFDNHASGRIINRISGDINTIDEIIPKNMYQVARHVCSMLGVYVVVSAINYYMILPTLILSGIFYYCLQAFRPVLNSLKKIAATRKSPIYSHVVTTIDGLTTIKASKAQKHSLSKFERHQDSYNSIKYLHQALDSSYAFWTEFTCMLYVAVVIFFLIIFKKSDMVGNVGLSITQSLLLTSSIQYMIRIYGDLDTQMTSVERVVEYDDLTIEDINKSEVNPPTTWPAEGKILFQSVSMRYSPEKPYILRNVDVEIHSGEKIGIVGRTGAGKSSLINALFHLYEYEGTILIDNVDIKMVPLGTLRSRIATVPQDPVLFSGTIRENLDPFKEFTDCQLWNVLEEVNLKHIVSNLPSGLSSSLSEAGVNFSTGQKQLMCLVRAILKKSTIIVLDEATAFLDLDTDKLIQATIQKIFHKATVLRIAHRLDSVMHSDKILVLDDGCVVEFGTPNELLQNVDGYFYKYVHEYENSSLNNQTSI